MSEFDPNNRQLCDDGACIGVIGPDGRCKECGRRAASSPYRGEAPGRQGHDQDHDSDQDQDRDQAYWEEESGEREHDAVAASHRMLCEDGACIGVIGPDGLCKECGRPGPRMGLNPRTRGLRSEEEIADQLEANIATSDLAAPPDGFEERQLCPDGSCIGVIGADGRCKECGARADQVFDEDDEDDEDEGDEEWDEDDEGDEEWDEDDEGDEEWDEDDEDNEDEDEDEDGTDDDDEAEKR